MRALLVRLARVAPPGGARELKAGKAHTGARARFSRTSRGRVASLGELTRSTAGTRHLNMHMTARRLNRLGGRRGVSAADLPRVRKLMPFS